MKSTKTEILNLHIPVTMLNSHWKGNIILGLSYINAYNLFKLKEENNGKI